MFFEEFAASANLLIADLLEETGYFLFASAGVVDIETASAWAGTLAHGRSHETALTLWTAALFGACLRATVLFEASKKGVIRWEGVDVSVWKNIEKYLARSTILQTAGLQFLFIARWALPLIAAHIGVCRRRFYIGTLIGLSIWSAFIALLAYGITYWCFPGLFGLAEARATLAGLLLATLIAVITLKTVLRRLIERIQSTNET